MTVSDAVFDCLLICLYFVMALITRLLLTNTHSILEVRVIMPSQVANQSIRIFVYLNVLKLSFYSGREHIDSAFILGHERFLF